MIRKKPMRRTSSAKRAKSSRQKAMEKADAAFSQYIRLKYADANGYCRCISCGKVLHWTEIQNGHYMSRRYMSTRFSEDNCRPQCVACNVFNQGNAQMYRLGLIKEFCAERRLLGDTPDKAFQSAQNRVDLTEAKARTSVAKYSDFELEEIAKFYQKQVEELKKEKNYGH